MVVGRRVPILVLCGLAGLGGALVPTLAHARPVVAATAGVQRAGTVTEQPGHGASSPPDATAADPTLSASTPSTTQRRALPSRPAPTAAPSVAPVASVTRPLSAGWGVVETSWPDVLGVGGLVGHTPTYSETYVHWGGGWGGIDQQLPALQTALAAGVTPIVTWMSDDPTTKDESAYALRAIASGAWDAYARSWADGLRSAGRTVLLRFDPEMNGDWMSWSSGVKGQSTADYVAAWRHLHALFVAEGAGNVQWVWSPNVEYAGSTPLPPLYPGDDVVDWVALDGYNWGNINSHAWQSFSSVFDASTAAVEAITNKPLMLAEVGCTESGGNKAAWITDMFTELAQRPDIRAFIWFDLDKETDWRITSSAASTAAFVAGLHGILG